MTLTKTQYDELMRAYDEKQYRRRHIIEDRRKEVYAAAPELTQLDQEIVHQRNLQARAMLNEDPEAAENCRRTVQELTGRRERIFSSLGCPADYLDPPYDCPDCRDTGFIGREQCHCFRQAAIDLIYTQSDLREVLKTENFATFSLDLYPADDVDPVTGLSSLENARLAENRCWQFTKNFDRNFENILLFGDTGLGKTFLTHCVAKELLESGHSVIYFSAQRLFELLADHAMRRESSRPESFTHIFDCDLLIIDDLGTEVPNAMTVSQFFLCLNERIRARKSTMISTNLSLQDIASIYSERISSRIMNDFTLLHLSGSDIRIGKRLSAGKR